MSRIELDLLPSAYGFLNESLRCLRRALDDEEETFRFAVIHAAQAVELILKERLRREHPLLVYRNVDRETVTVSSKEALQRLDRCDVKIDSDDRTGAIEAHELRNELVHFEVSASLDQLLEAYVSLIEFAYAFHLRELEEELHSHVEEDLHQLEALCIELFDRSLIKYQGAEVVSTHPISVVRAQYRTHRLIDGELLPRVPFGDEGEGWPESEHEPGDNCHGCAVLVGQYHTEGCDMEICPACGGQWLGCVCEDQALDEIRSTA